MKGQHLVLWMIYSLFVEANTFNTHVWKTLNWKEAEFPEPAEQRVKQFYSLVLTTFNVIVVLISHLVSTCFDIFFFHQKGDDCPYRHEPLATGKPVCDLWKSGSCKRNPCRFRHVNVEVKTNSGTYTCWQYNLKNK
jgi:hypothetical protein